MFPTLEPAEIERVRRFGTACSYGQGDPLSRVGEVNHGFTIILSGKVEVTRRDAAGRHSTIVVHHAGSFLGELAQLAGRPSLVDADALEPVEALTIPPDRLRALLIAEAELGERIMRAMILRRVGLLETSSGGPSSSAGRTAATSCRLASFLRRNGHPHQLLDIDNDAEARALIERFHIAPGELPIALCPSGRFLRNPGRTNWRDALDWFGPSIPSACMTWLWSAPVRRDSRRRFTAGSEGLSVLMLDCRAFGGQAGSSSRIENYLGFPTGISGMALMARAYNQAQKFGVEAAIPDEATALEILDGGRVPAVVADGEYAKARSVVVATGARYRQLEVENMDQFEMSSIHYGHRRSK